MSRGRGGGGGGRCLRVALLLAALVALAASARFYPDKRSSGESRPFVLGSRYGRSGPPAPLHLTPRNDRFFMGSRYGKRSAEGDAAGGGGQEVDAAEAPAAADALSCRYTGLYRLYRCTLAPRSTPPPAPPRSSEPSDLTDEILADDFN